MASSVRGAASVVAFGLLACAQIASAQTVMTGNKGTLTVKGFISATAFAQNQSFTFGNGQNAEFPSPPELSNDRWFLGGDVRNTRITLSFDGPEVENAPKFGGGIEIDFFGGFNGTGAFSDEQATPRLRLAYVDVKKGRTTYRVGQYWSPLFGNVPVSLSHVAFPLGYGAAGDVGWRFPGLFVYQDLGSPNAKVKTKLTVAAMRGSWSGPGDNLNSLSAGEAAFKPQVEARLDWDGKTSNGGWGAYVVGHWDQKDLSGVGATAPNDSLTGTAVEVGAKVSSGPFSLQGNVYSGKAIGQQFAAITQFGDIKSTGGWAQAGFKFNKNWAGYLFYGFDDPNDKDVVASANSRLKDVLGAASMQYSVGPYAFSFEWLQSKLTTHTAGGDLDTTGDQVSTSVMYKF
jgi:hypothetical protein